MTVPAKPATLGELTESVFIQGDLSGLTEEQRTQYYFKVCESLGLNPYTRPFEYTRLNNKLQLYARRDCADQLRKLHGISVSIVSQDRVDDLLLVHVRAVDKESRQDEDLGAVPFPETLRGEGRANAIMKGVTKAKRRVTLSLAGLGFLDESEIEDALIEAAKRPTLAPNVMKPSPPPAPSPLPTVAEPAETPTPAPSQEAGVSAVQLNDEQLKAMAREAAARGTDVLRGFYGNRTRANKESLKSDQTFWDELVATAEKVDKSRGDR